jgi:hypothetical protein
MSLTTALIILFFVAMIAMHLRGHGGHSSHGGGCGGHGHARDDSSADRTAGEPLRRDHSHV